VGLVVSCETVLGTNGLLVQSTVSVPGEFAVCQNGVAVEDPQCVYSNGGLEGRTYFEVLFSNQGDNTCVLYETIVTLDDATGCEQSGSIECCNGGDLWFSAGIVLEGVAKEDYDANEALQDAVVASIAKELEAFEIDPRRIQVVSVAQLQSGGELEVTFVVFVDSAEEGSLAMASLESSEYRANLEKFVVENVNSGAAVTIDPSLFGNWPTVLPTAVPTFSSTAVPTVSPTAAPTEGGNIDGEKSISNDGLNLSSGGADFRVAALFVTVGVATCCAFCIFSVCSGVPKLGREPKIQAKEETNASDVAENGIAPGVPPPKVKLEISAPKDDRPQPVPPLLVLDSVLSSGRIHGASLSIQVESIQDSNAEIAASLSPRETKASSSQGESTNAKRNIKRPATVFSPIASKPRGSAVFNGLNGACAASTVLVEPEAVIEGTAAKYNSAPVLLPPIEHPVNYCEGSSPPHSHLRSFR
jgi:hypothetical protein